MRGETVVSGAWGEGQVWGEMANGDLEVTTTGLRRR